MNVQFTQRSGITYIIANKSRSIVKHTIDEYEAYLIRFQMTNLFDEEFSVEEIV